MTHKTQAAERSSQLFVRRRAEVQEPTGFQMNLLFSRTPVKADRADLAVSSTISHTAAAQFLRASTETFLENREVAPQNAATNPRSAVAIALQRNPLHDGDMFTPPWTDDRGFTLIEVIIVTALLVTMSVGIAQLAGIAMLSVRSARERTSATVLAAAKMEQLRSLVWAYESSLDSPPVPRSDVSSNLSVDPPDDSGPGLAPSPPDTLSSNVSSHVDYLDAKGQWIGTGAAPASEAMFIRRWSVQPLPDDPGRTLIFQVLVTTTRQERTRNHPWRERVGEECLLVSIRTRRGQ
jgi:prepilin-type N-terminal cleavage/methylation domain-containing protein